MAIAVFGVVLARAFDARVQPSLDRLALAPTVRTDIERQLPKMAGAELETVASLAPSQRSRACAARSTLRSSTRFAS